MATLISALLLSFVPVTVYGTFILTSSGDLLTGSTISIVCNIPTFIGTATWLNPSVAASAIHACTSGFCLSSNPSYPRYTFSVTTNTFTLTITGATLDDDSWTCEQDTPADSGPITLGLKVAPTTCTLTESGGTYSCTTSCGYPVNDLYIHAKLNGTSNSQDLSPLNTESTPACTSPESAYSATVPTSFFTQDADLYCECGVTGYASTAVQSNSLAVTESSTAKPNSTTNSYNSGDNKIIAISVSSGCGGGIILTVVVVVVVRKRKNNEAADRESSAAERVPSNSEGNCKQNDDSNAFNNEAYQLTQEHVHGRVPSKSEGDCKQNDDSDAVNNEAYQLTQEHVHGRVPSKSEGDCKQNDDSDAFNNEAYGHSPEHNQRM